MSTTLLIFLIFSLGGSIGLIIFFFIKNKNPRQLIESLIVWAIALAVLYVLFYSPIATIPKGDSENDIPAGTSFKDLPDDWTCPICGASKDDFELEE